MDSITRLVIWCSVLIVGIAWSKTNLACSGVSCAEDTMSSSFLEVDSSYCNCGEGPGGEDFPFVEIRRGPPGPRHRQGETTRLSLGGAVPLIKLFLIVCW